MRHCPHCSQLIQDATGYCRFCRRDVTPAMACSDKWTQFGDKFHRLSAAGQQTAWDQLESDDRVHAQKVLGIVPPQLPGLREAIAADLTGSRRSRRSGSLFSFCMVLSFCLLVIAGAYFLLPIIEAPISESGDGDTRALSTSERIDQVIDRAYETVTLLVADFGGAGTGAVSSRAGELADTISSRAVEFASDTQPPAPPNP